MRGNDTEWKFIAGTITYPLHLAHFYTNIDHMKIDQLQNLLKPGCSGNCLALFAGAILTLAFAPFFIFPLAILSPALLLGLWLYVTPKQAFLRGWLFGLGFFGTGVYWVFISIHTYGNASVLLAGFITCVFIAFLALFPAIAGYLLNRYFPYPKESKIIFAFSALWLLLEWIRSWIFTGFPWLLLGDSQIYSPLKGYAPVLGVYGVSFAVLLSSGLLVNSIIKAYKHNYKNMTINLFLIGTIWVIGGGLSFLQWTKPQGSPIQVSLVQGNIDQELKWSFDHLALTLNLYRTLTQENWGSKLIIWPENAIPLSLQNAMDFVDNISKEAKDNNATLITGIPIQNGNENNYFNAVIAIGNDYNFYLKQKLVPFGEYTPFANYLTKIMDHFKIPMSSMVPSNQETKPLFAQGLEIATFICYEIAFPELVRAQSDRVGILLTVSNDAWFGHSIASAQHMAMAQMRAIELRKPALFVSNTGITSIIRPDGTIQSAIPPFKTAVLTDKVQAMSGKTLWQQRGMDPLLLSMITFLIISLKSQRKTKKKRAK